jgi:hypothetical protein
MTQKAPCLARASGTAGTSSGIDAAFSTSKGLSNGVDIVAPAPGKHCP